MSPRTVEERRAYRAFLRATHPDLGGDPDAFVAGLARWRAAAPPPAPTTGAVSFHHRRRGVGVFLDWLLEARRRRRRAPRVR